MENDKIHKIDSEKEEMRSELQKAMDRAINNALVKSLHAIPVSKIEDLIGEYNAVCIPAIDNPMQK